MAEEKKLSSLQLALSEIDKAFGKGVARQASAITPVDFIPTSFTSLNEALGIGGVPKGRIIEIFGPESSGKTTLALHIIAQVQKTMNEPGALIDAEFAYYDKWGESIGIDNNNLLIVQPDNGEQAFETAETSILSGIPIVVIDSVSALVPKSEIENGYGEGSIAAQARMMSQCLRKLVSVVSKSNSCVIFINQTRSKIGVMYGNPETTTGGAALKFYATMRLHVSGMAESTQKLKDQNKDDEGNIKSKLIKVKVVKNKVAPPFREAEFRINFQGGLTENSSEVIDTLIHKGVIEKKGPWFIVKETGEKFKGAQSFLEAYEKEDSPLKKKVI